jgi:hypothetical protein
MARFLSDNSFPDVNLEIQIIVSGHEHNMSKDFVLYGSFFQQLNDRRLTSDHTGELSVKYPKLGTSGTQFRPQFGRNWQQNENSRWMNTRNQIRFAQTGNEMRTQERWTQGTKLVFSHITFLRSVSPLVLDLPSSSLVGWNKINWNKILQIFWTDTQFHETVPKFPNWITKVLLWVYPSCKPSYLHLTLIK